MAIDRSMKPAVLAGEVVGLTHPEATLANNLRESKSRRTHAKTDATCPPFERRPPEVRTMAEAQLKEYRKLIMIWYTSAPAVALPGESTSVWV